MELGSPSSPTERTGIKSRSVHHNLSGRDCGLGRRHLVAGLAFLGFANVYALRANLSIALVAMTANRTAPGEPDKGPEFDWSPGTQGVVLSSFFYGYAVTQLPVGWLAARVGGARLMGAGVALAALIALATPALAGTSVYLLALGRVAQGLAEGGTFPCMHAVWCRWAPPAERSQLATFAFAGSYVGTVVTMPVAAALANSLGWRSVFYVFGLLALLWCVAWTKLVSESPATDRRISVAEREMICSAIGQQVQDIDIPWKLILRSPAVWAITVAHFCENWGFYTLLTELPAFMRDVLAFDLEKAGLLSALPYLAMGLSVPLAGLLADWLRKDILTTTQTRKILNCSAFLVQAVFLTLASHVASPVAVVGSITIAVGCGGFAWAGFGVNHLDVAPQYASVLMGLSNTFASLPGMLSPLLTGHLVQNKAAEEWRSVFLVASLLYVAGAAIYVTLASGDRQWWAEPKPNFSRESSTEDLLPANRRD